MKKLSVVTCTVLLAAFALAEDNVLAKHQAFRKEINANPSAAEKYLNDQDAEIRRFAVYTLAKNNAPNTKKIILKAAQDENSMVRLTAVSAMTKLAAEDADILKQLDQIARTDNNTQIRQVALKASWPFHRETVLLRDDKDWDHTVVVAHSFTIPEDNWKLKTDPQINGHIQGWFKPDYNDADWSSVKLGYWENQGFRDYDGFAWYRIKFKMPAKMDFTSIELAFGAVDEGAWVWLNGTYLGSHDIGTSGWNQPFALDCRKEAKWGEENVLVIRVQDTNAGGGIWKPITVEILK